MGIVYVTGASGMLGQAVIRALDARSLSEVPTYVELTHTAFDITDHDHIQKLSEDSTVINCAGITKGRTDVSPSQMVKVNSYGPLLLAERVRRLVQVSTDCVFSGEPNDIPHSEVHTPSPSDFYGLTKLAGETPRGIDNPHLTVRGSFIGFGSRGLLAWLLAHEKYSRVEGYYSWLWSGLYVQAFARILVELALTDKCVGLRHIVGPVITKYELLRRIAEKIRPDLNIIPRVPPPRDMSLRSIHTMWNTFTIPTWDEMMEELDGDYRAGAGRAVSGE